MDCLPRHIILVEDDVELAHLITDFLHKHQFDVTHIISGKEAAKRIVEEQPELVILDIMLPDMNGMEVCKQIRAHYTGPILMQTALDDDIDQMMGLELGADDYVIKQVQPRLLLSRIKALLRRSEASRTPSARPLLRVGALTLDLATRSVALSGQDIELTTAEFELLHLLAKHPGQVVSRDNIVKALRGYDYDGLDRSIDRRVSRLRRKLQCETNAQTLIKTIRSQGYQLCLEDQR